MRSSQVSCWRQVSKGVVPKKKQPKTSQQTALVVFPLMFWEGGGQESGPLKKVEDKTPKEASSFHLLFKLRSASESFLYLSSVHVCPPSSHLKANHGSKSPETSDVLGTFWRANGIKSNSQTSSAMSQQVYEESPLAIRKDEKNSGYTVLFRWLCLELRRYAFSFQRNKVHPG